MSAKKPRLLLAVFFVAIVGACFLYIFLSSGEGAKTACVYVDGELFRRIDLSAAAKPYELEVGEGNTLYIERDGVTMLHASCPDKLCVKRGKAGAGGLPIVCLPNRVVVVIDSGSGGIDAVVG